MIHPTALHVVTAISNPVRYQSRYNLFRSFDKYVKDSGATLYTGEVAYGERPHEVTESGNPRHLQLRTGHEIWMKERTQNLVVQSRIPADAQYIAFVDGDVRFEREDWAEETIQQLQHYDVVQMFSHAVDLGPESELVQTHFGFAYSYVQGNGKKSPADGVRYNKFWHPGYAWAMRRSAFDALGGLIDTAILGSGDHHMATALIGCVDFSYPKDLHEGYKRPLHQWQTRAEAHIRRNMGYVPGMLRHQWHGSKASRQYESRWQILTNNQFNPETDIKPDSQGLWQLCHGGHRLRDQVRMYNRTRREDSMENDQF